MQDWIDHFLDRQRRNNKVADGTVKVRQRDLKKYNAYLEENDLDVDEAAFRDVDDFLLDMGQKYAEATVNSIYISVKQLYEHIIKFEDDWGAEDHPMANAEWKEYGGNGNGKQDEIVYIEPAEVDAMCEALEGKYELRDEILIRLLFQTGIRAAEAENLLLENLDMENMRVKVYSDKTGEWRTVPYQASLDPLVRKWVEGGKRDAMYEGSEYLFPTQRSEKFAAPAINNMIRRTADEAGVQEVLFEDAKGDPRYKVTAHTLRHSCAVELLKSGVDITFIKEHLGHKDISTTQQYLKVLPTDAESEVRAKWGTREEGDEFPQQRSVRG